MPKGVPAQDLPVGFRSGHLEVVGLQPDHTNPSGIRYQRVTVRCDCGYEYQTNALNLRRGTKHCWYCANPTILKYRVGDVYDQLTVLGFHYDASGRRIAECQCRCGGKTDVFVGLFARNKTLNCGCSPIGSYQGCGDLSGAYYYSLKSGAEKRKLSFNVSKEFLWDLFCQQKKLCALTGVPITLWVRDRKEGTASLDRIDSEVGYDPGNVQWVHKDINRMKQNFKQTRFLELCALVSDYQRGVLAASPEIPSGTQVRPRVKPGRKPTAQG
jgi:hypothetical protein